MNNIIKLNKNTFNDLQQEEIELSFKSPDQERFKNIVDKIITDKNMEQLLKNLSEK